MTTRARPRRPTRRRQVRARRHPPRVLAAVGVALAVVLAATACESEDDDDERDAAVYAAIIRDLVDEVDPDDDDLVVHVYSLEERDVSIVVQADLLDRFERVAAVRFVDEFKDAVDADEPGNPAKAEGMVVGLGAVEEDDENDDVVTVRATSYRERDQDEGIVYTGEERGDEWEVSRTGSFDPSEGR